MALGETLREFGVKVSLIWDAKKFEEAQNKVDKFGGKLKGFAFEVAGTAAGLFGIGKAATYYSRNLKTTADTLGISTDALQEWGYAAKVAADVNQDELNESMGTLTDTIARARAGSEDARQALLQISIAAGKGDQAMQKLNDGTYGVEEAFQDLTLGASKLSQTDPKGAERLTQMLTGNAKLYQLFRQGPQAVQRLTEEGKRNATVSKSMIEQGYKLDVQLSKIYAMFRKFGVEIGIVTMSKLMPLIRQFTLWFTKNRQLISSGIVEFVKDFAKALQVGFEVASSLVKALTPLIEKVGGVQNAVKILMATFLAFKTAQIVTAFAQMGAALGIAFGPVTAVVLGLGSLAAIVHDIWSVLSGGKLEDTWLGQIGTTLDKMTGGKLNFGDKIYDSLFGNAEDKMIKDRMDSVDAMAKRKAYGKVVQAISGPGAGPQFSVASPAYVGGGNAIPSPMSQNLTLNNNSNITIGHGTSAKEAVDIISQSHDRAIEKMLQEAKQDASTTRTN